MKTWIRNITHFSGEGRKVVDVGIEGEYITDVEDHSITVQPGDQEINGEGLWLMPGFIDDQVHFREPGLTHKADLYTESRAALLGGVTSFMEMPNTQPPAFTLERLEWKYQRAAEVSPANYSFYLGGADHNLEEVKRIHPAQICGLKIFMGSSTGDLLVEDEGVLHRLFKHSPVLIATHCEDDHRIKSRMAEWALRYPNGIPASAHPDIRDREACIQSTVKAIRIAKETGARLHVLHISTADETLLFEMGPIHQKKITAEACVHHLWFSDQDYERLGNQIKCNPAIKKVEDRNAVLRALEEGRIDVLATDHAPHTWEEKYRPYPESPSGLPLVQHSMLLALELAYQNKISVERVISAGSERVADLFGIVDRGYIKPGYKADLVLVNPHKQTVVKKEDLHYKCGWSPLEGETFHHQIEKVWVNGILKVEQGKLVSDVPGQRLTFQR